MAKHNESRDHSPVPSGDVESPVSNAPLATQEIPRFNSPVHIIVTTWRMRKHDPDGISVKAVLDGLVAKGVLRDDSLDEVESITFRSYRGKEEKTIITITDQGDA